MATLTLDDVLEARQRHSAYLLTTPIEPAPALGENIYFKLENTNVLHSFKIRGALNAIMAQEIQARQFGVVTSSAGNHGLGLVYVADMLGINATVVMPKHAPRRKIDGVMYYGANVILHGDIYDDAERFARQLEQDQKAVFVSPYNDPYVIAGQGTIGLELLEQMPQMGRVIVPVGGGGLISGVGMAIKSIRPTIEVIGVQSVGTAAMHNYLYGSNLYQDPKSLADGLSGDIEEGSITIDLCRNLQDKLILVDESDIAYAIAWIFHKHGWIIEGSGAVGVAAILSERLPVDDVPTAILLTGGNIDADKFLQIANTQVLL